MRRVITGIALVVLAGCSLLRPHASGRSHAIPRYESAPLSAEEIGAARFLFDDFNGLSTDTLEGGALPWKIVATAMLLDRRPDAATDQAALIAELRGFGMFVPVRVRNWPSSRQPEFPLPVGLVTGDIRRRVPHIELEVAAIGCASCHAGTLYDRNGDPTFEAWLGAPNTSIDLDAYVDAAYAGLRRYRDNPAPVLAAIPTLFPDTSPQELATIRTQVWPRLAQRVRMLEAAGEPLPYRNGGPGRSNGFEQLKQRLGVRTAHAGDIAAVSIPALWERELRSSLLVDGMYAPLDAAHFVPRNLEQGKDPARLARLAVFFTVITMGVPHRQAPQSIGAMTDVMRYLDAHASRPPYPGSVHADLAARGAQVYAARCEGCHGRYVESPTGPELAAFPNRLVPLANIGTDPGRITYTQPEVLERFAASTFGRYIDAKAATGYVAPILTGVWATAPYLHNGSVPTLWHLLHPEQRPRRFMVGGHRLDLERVGIAGELRGQDWRYPQGYAPWSQPQLFDTTLPGHRNSGHAKQVARLDEEERRAVLEYLKRL